MKPKVWFFEKVVKINKSLCTLTKKKRTQITVIKNERGGLTADPEEVK